MGRGVSLAKTTRPSAASVLPRERLFAAVDACRRARLLWVHGPPGCGKTSLVSSYLDARGSHGLWYQMDAGDADPATLCLYLGEAVNGGDRRLPLFTAEYRSEPGAFTRHYFGRLFEALSPPFLLVFDNYQELGSDGAVHEMLRDAAAELPADGCIAVLSRAPPPAVFIRMRANRELEVLDWDALRLTRDESDAIAGAQVPDAQEPELAALYERTDGWAAGLILALAQRREGEPELPASAAPALLFDYLAGEVFSTLEPELGELLTRTACVEEMSVELAAALAGEPRAGELLDSLHRRHQMLTLKPGPNGPVYACHPLLREFLRTRAQYSLPPAERARIAHEAARVLEAEGAVDAAIRLLSRADSEAMAGVLLRHAAAMLAEGRAQTLERWLEALPSSHRDADPWLTYWLGACRFQRDPADAERLFADAWERFAQVSRPPVDGLALTAAGAMHALIFALDDLSALDGWIARAEDLADGEPPATQAAARFAVSLFMALVFRQPHHPAIGHWAEQAWAACRTLEDAQLRLSTQLLLAINLNYTGQFDRALEFLQGMRGHAESPEAQPLERTTLKAVESMYHMLNADAEPCLRAVLDGLEIGDDTGVHLWSYHLLSNGVAGALGVGDTDTAAELLERMHDYAGGARRLDRAGHHYHQAWHAMLGGDLDRAAREQRTALALAEEVGCPFYAVLCRMALCQGLVERGEIPRAGEEARAVMRAARRINNRLLQFSAWLTAADVALEAGRASLGHAALRRGLQIGRERGFSHFLGWQPRFVSRVCAAALEAGIEVDYVRWLIRARGLAPPAAGPARGLWPWRIAIRSLGGFSLELDGAPGARLSGKPLALLKALVALGAERVEESALASLLWPRIDSDYAHRSLTTTLHRLRKLVGEDAALRLRHGRLSLDRDLCRLDLHALEQVLAGIDALDGRAPSTVDALAALAGELLDVYRGPFMDGDRDEVYQPLRERVRNRVLGGLDDLARACERAGDPARALGFYRRAIDQDPLAEAFHRRLMLSLRDLGRRVEAVEAYANCKSLMEAALGTPPSAETQAIYEAVRREI